jgi:hypothetical protein
MKNENINIIVEGRIDAQIIQVILESETELSFDYYVSGGYSSAISMAKTLLLKKQNSTTILIIDADSTREEEINTRKEFVESYLSNRIELKSNFKLVIFSPELLSIFFHSKELLEKITGISLSDSDFIIGQSSPKKFITSNTEVQNIIKSLNKELISQIKTHPSLKELFNFINKRIAIAV